MKRVLLLHHTFTLLLTHWSYHSLVLIHQSESPNNSLAPNDAIWRQRSSSTLAQVMACCLTAPSHYLNQSWLINTKILRHSSEGIIMKRMEDTYKQNKNEIWIFKFASRSPRDQWNNWWYNHNKTKHKRGACFMKYTVLSPLVWSPLTCNPCNEYKCGGG